MHRRIGPFLLLVAVVATMFGAGCQFPECWTFDWSAIRDEALRQGERDLGCERASMTVSAVEVGGANYAVRGCGLEALYSCSADRAGCRDENARCTFRSCGRARLLTTHEFPRCPQPEPAAK